MIRSVVLFTWLLSAATLPAASAQPRPQGLPTPPPIVELTPSERSELSEWVTETELDLPWPSGPSIAQSNTGWRRREWKLPPSRELTPSEITALSEWISEPEQDYHGQHCPNIRAAAAYESSDHKSLDARQILTTRLEESRNTKTLSPLICGWMEFVYYDPSPARYSRFILFHAADIIGLPHRTVGDKDLPEDIKISIFTRAFELAISNYSQGSPKIEGDGIFDHRSLMAKSGYDFALAIEGMSMSHITQGASFYISRELAFFLRDALFGDLNYSAYIKEIIELDSALRNEAVQGPESVPVILSSVLTSLREKL